MAITNGYTTLAKLKARLAIATLDVTDDADLETIVQSVSRSIDDFCGRRFYAATETRYYTADQQRCLLIDDLLSITTLKTDNDADGVYEIAWATTDYLLSPYNAPLESTPQPYWRIEVTVLGINWFPRGVPKGVQIIGSWGFSATTPDVVASACLFQAALEYRASKSSGGVSGKGEMGTEIRAAGLHPFTRRMLEPYRRVIAV